VAFLTTIDRVLIGALLSGPPATIARY
jgi:hypothetical protein